MNWNPAGPFRSARRQWGGWELCYPWDEAVRRTRADTVPAGSGDQPEHARTSTHGGDGELKRVVTWLVVAFIIFYVIQAPEASAQIVRNIGTALGNAASSSAAFIGSLV